MDMLRAWGCRGGRGCVEDVWLVWREEEMMRMMTCIDMGTKTIVKICRRRSIGRGQAGRLLPLLSARVSVLLRDGMNTLPEAAEERLAC